MVGRDNELSKLEFQIMNAINGEGSIVNVIGEAGIGKSRLIAELKIRERMKRVTLLEGRAISMGAKLGYHLFIDLLKNWAQITEDDSEVIAFTKLESSIRRTYSEALGEIFPFVATPGFLCSWGGSTMTGSSLPPQTGSCRVIWDSACINRAPSSLLYLSL